MQIIMETYFYSLQEKMVCTECTLFQVLMNQVSTMLLSVSRHSMVHLKHYTNPKSDNNNQITGRSESNTVVVNVKVRRSNRAPTISVPQNYTTTVGETTLLNGTIVEDIDAGFLPIHLHIHVNESSSGSVGLSLPSIANTYCAQNPDFSVRYFNFYLLI